MKLDRSTKGRNKYGLILRRKLDAAERIHSPQGLTEIEYAVKVLETAGIIDWGATPETEFFVMRLKDQFAAGGLAGYAASAANSDDEYAREVWDLSQRSGPHHPNCKKPD